MYSQQFTSIVGELVEWYTSLSTNIGELAPNLLSLYAISAHKKGNSFEHAMKAYNQQQMAAKHNYNKQGKLSGLYQCWYSNSQKEQEGVVINGKKNGTWHYWEKRGDKTMERFFLLGITIKTKHLKSVS